jgi:hypothetical protein
MRTIKVNWAYIETAFERNSPEIQSYIDGETGDVVVVVEGVPENEELRRRVASDPERYIRIDPASSRKQYQWMERFVASVEDPQLRDRLLIAIDGKGAFRRFKDVLLGFPMERERWFNYRADLLHHNINQWFESKQLVPDPPSPWGQVEPPEETEALPKTSSQGQGLADILRKQIKALVDMLPACELSTAQVFLEYLRDRGSGELAAAATGNPRAETPPSTEEPEEPIEPDAEADLPDLPEASESEEPSLRADPA